MKPDEVGFADGGGRGGSDEGVWFRPGGGGKDMMNGKLEKKTL